MAGIDYGNRYQLMTALNSRKAGVVYMPNIKKYLVRTKKNGCVKTRCAYKYKACADKKYLELTAS